MRVRAEEPGRIVLIDENALIGEAIKTQLQKEVTLPIEVLHSIEELDNGPYDIVFVNLSYHRSCQRIVKNIEKVGCHDFKKLVVFSNLCLAESNLRVTDERVTVLCKRNPLILDGQSDSASMGISCCETCDVFESEGRDASHLLCGRIETLSAREKEILKMIGRGLSSKQIAERLSVSKRTVDFHRTNILKKLDLRRLSQVIGILVYFMSDFIE